MKGFRLLETACEDLTRKLAESEEKVCSREQAYAALEEKVHSGQQAYAALEEIAKSNEASYKELVLKTDDQIRSHEAVFTELVSQAREKIHIDAATHAMEVSWMDEKLQASELATSKLAKKIEDCESALKNQELVSFVSFTGAPRANRYTCLGTQLST